MKAPELTGARVDCAHARLGTRAVRISSGARDLDGRTSAWLGDNGVVAALIRPAPYAHGSARTADELPVLIDDLRERLGMAVA